jgi:hypothetical protein
MAVVVVGRAHKSDALDGNSCSYLPYSSSLSRAAEDFAANNRSLAMVRGARAVNGCGGGTGTCA